MFTDKKQKIINAINAGTSINEIAKKIKIPKKHLQLLLGAWGVPLSSRKKYQKIKTPPRDELVDIYNQKRSIEKVAKHFKVSPSTATQWIEKLKIPKRKLMKMNREEKISLLEQHIERMAEIDI